MSEFDDIISPDDDDYDPVVAETIRRVYAERHRRRVESIKGISSVVLFIVVSVAALSFAGFVAYQFGQRDIRASAEYRHAREISLMRVNEPYCVILDTHGDPSWGVMRKGDDSCRVDPPSGRAYIGGIIIQNNRFFTE